MENKFCTSIYYSKLQAAGSIWFLLLFKFAFTNFSSKNSQKFYVQRFTYLFCLKQKFCSRISLTNQQFPDSTIFTSPNFNCFFEIFSKTKAKRMEHSLKTDSTIVHLWIVVSRINQKNGVVTILYRKRLTRFSPSKTCKRFTKTPISLRFASAVCILIFKEKNGGRIETQDESWKTHQKFLKTDLKWLFTPLEKNLIQIPNKTLLLFAALDFAFCTTNFFS